MNSLSETLNLFRGDWLPTTISEWWPMILVFLAATGLFLLVARAMRRKPTADEIRLRKIRDASALDGSDDGLFGSMTEALAAQIPESGRETRDFKLLLRQAGMYKHMDGASIYAARFVLLFLPLVGTGIWAVFADAEHTFTILSVGALVAGGLSVIPRLYVFFRRRRRMARIQTGLADTVDMLSMCASGGLGLSESLQHVAGQMGSCPELAQELMILKRQSEVGSLKQALADLATRVDLPEMRQLAALLTRGASLGTKLAGSLNDQADHLRTARRQAANSRANRTPVKMVLPVLFCFAPAALILLTAPAMLELHDFLVPPAVTAVQEDDSSLPSFGTKAILDAMDTLDQRASSPMMGDTTVDSPTI